MKKSLIALIRISLTSMLMGALLVPFAWARWMMPTQMPVTRLLKNVGDYVKAHPKDEHGYYTLGRINSAAFAQDTETVGVYTRDVLPNFPAQSGLTPQPRDKAKPLPPRALTYVADAVGNYKKATALDGTDGLAWLGLGFQLEEALPFPQAMAKAWTALGLPGKLDVEKLRQESLRNYRKAYALTVKADAGPTAHLVDPVSIEAAQGIVRLLQNHRLSSTERTELTEMTSQIADYRSKPRPMTPILISFDRSASLANLLDKQKQVRFDLAGDGLGRSWPWVKPTTGILVWDPKHTGKITSGLQLFGSVTWWLFWKDGYEPLSALDNDRNGWLEGPELAGICVWFDRNGNGVADPGEVVSLKTLGIRRIAARSEGLTEGVPGNLNGVQLQDGSYLATFDWTPTSIHESLRGPDAASAQSTDKSSARSTRRFTP